MAQRGSEILIAGRRYDVGRPVTTFADPGGFNGYLERCAFDPARVTPKRPAPGVAGRARRYRRRRGLGPRPTIGDLRAAVRQVVVHLDGCGSARTCFRVLHDERGLSAHFLVDGDGTIYQTLDVAACAFHARGVNDVAVGIELQNRGDAARFPNFYGGARRVVTCRVHRAQFLAYDFTEAQYASMTALGRVLARVLDIPLAAPEEGSRPVWTTIPHPARFRGFLGHYHVSRRKWDPGPFDFRRLFRRVAARVTFPLGPARLPDGKRGERAFAILREAYADNAAGSGRGSFPVGPAGRATVWHGGVHLAARPGAPVMAPIAGSVVAAGGGRRCALGDRAFVLVRHRFHGAKQVFTFFSLYQHLAGWGRRGLPEPAWLASEKDGARRLAAGETLLLDAPVEAGDLLGACGLVGPRGARQAEIHFAVFAADEGASALDPGYWHRVDGGKGRLVRAPEIVALMDRPSAGRPRDGRISRREILAFFRRDPRRRDLAHLVVRHRSDATPGGWEAVFAADPTLRRLSRPERRRVFDEQVRPFLWWTPALAEWCGLPEDDLVYSYHPLGFLDWYRRVERLQRGRAAAGIAGRDRWRGVLPPASLKADTDDFATDDSDGADARAP